MAVNKSFSKREKVDYVRANTVERFAASGVDAGDH